MLPAKFKTLVLAQWLIFLWSVGYSVLSWTQYNAFVCTLLMHFDHKIFSVCDVRDQIANNKFLLISPIIYLTSVVNLVNGSYYTCSNVHGQAMLHITGLVTSHNGCKRLQWCIYVIVLSRKLVSPTSSLLDLHSLHFKFFIWYFIQREDLYFIPFYLSSKATSVEASLCSISQESTLSRTRKHFFPMASFLTSLGDFGTNKAVKYLLSKTNAHIWLAYIQYTQLE